MPNVQCNVEGAAPMYICLFCCCCCYCFRFEIAHCDIWFIRFCVDFKHELLALGNTAGKLSYWELTADDPSKMKSVVFIPTKIVAVVLLLFFLFRAHHLSHNKCVSAIRQVTISKDGT